jgi:hypothetical protein
MPPCNRRARARVLPCNRDVRFCISIYNGYCYCNRYLLFENPTEEENSQLVDGSSLGKLLDETNVPVLVLNACRSAHADPRLSLSQYSPPKTLTQKFGR